MKGETNPSKEFCVVPKLGQAEGETWEISASYFHLPIWIHQYDNQLCEGDKKKVKK